MKKYKVGSLVYTARDEHSDFENSPACGPGVRIICWSAMNALINDGIATEVREPIVASGIMEFNGTGFCQSSMVPACGLTYNQVSDKKFKVTMVEVIE